MDTGHLSHQMELSVTQLKKKYIINISEGGWSNLPIFSQKLSLQGDIKSMESNSIRWLQLYVTEPDTSGRTY